MTDSAQKVLKYTGIFPAFYACYDEAGEISPSRTRELAKYLLAQGSRAFMSTAPRASAYT